MSERDWEYWERARSTRKPATGEGPVVIIPPPGSAPAAPPDPAPDAAPAKKPPVWANLVEKRRHERVQTIRFARVEGKLGSFSAVITNVSRSGALLLIADPEFVIQAEDQGFSMAGLKVASHFGEGMWIRFPGNDFFLEAEVVRLVEQPQEGGEVSIGIGCRFLRDLTEEESAFFRLPPLPQSEGGSAAQAPAVSAAGPAIVVAEGGAVRSPTPRGPSRIELDGKRCSIDDLLTLVVERGASDLHLKGGSPIRIRCDGTLEVVGGRAITPEEAVGLIQSLLTPEQFARFEEVGDLDVAYSLEGQARFRVNVLRARGAPGMAIRRIPQTVPSPKELGLAPACIALAERPRGLVLVTGPTGSGKSTTLAAMIHHINETRACHILTMEDPIEYLHSEIQAHITQREVGRDTEDFASALKRAMRQDPNVILVGEMRDLETISLAVTAAETGHLVFATLHTTSASLTVDRIVDVFPPAQQRQVRMQLADCLQGIVCQLLLPRIGSGVVCAQEILIANTGIRSLIREGKTPQIGNMMQTGAKEGMQTLEDALNDLIARDIISYDTAVAKANHPRAIEKNGKPLGRAPATRSLKPIDDE